MIGRAGVVLLLGPTAGHCLDYSLDSQLSLGSFYYSNILMQPTPSSEWGGSVNLAASLLAAAETWGFTAKTQLQNYFYTPDSAINRQNQYLNVGAYALTERSRYELTGNYTNEYLVANENPSITGALLGKLHRDIKGIGPTWRYALTELTEGQIGYSFTRSEYQFYIPNYYPDSDTHTVFGKLTQRYTERLNLLADSSFTAYIADSSQTNAVRYGYPVAVYSSSRGIEYFSLTAGADYAADDTLHLNFSAGGQYSHSGSYYNIDYRIVGYELVNAFPPVFTPVITPTRYVTPARDTLGPLFQFGGLKRFEKDQVHLTYSRQIMPSINGFLLQADRVVLTESHDFRENLAGTLLLAYTHQSYNSSVTGLPGFTGGALSFYQASGNLTYRFDKNWASTVSYGYMLRNWDESQIPATDNHQVLLTLTYTFDTQKF